MELVALLKTPAREQEALALIARSPKLAQEADKTGMTPLHHAARRKAEGPLLTAIICACATAAGARDASGMLPPPSAADTARRQGRACWGLARSPS